jgi:hypothetical protein
MSEWQLIESAPKDGNPVLIAGEVALPRIGYFNRWEGVWSDAYSGRLVDGYTHWMPLPERPGTKRETEAQNNA